jgi:hypothetical protein
MLRKAPFTLPAGFLAAFGYPGSRRFVALFWEPCGDEAMCDNWLYLDFIRQQHVRRWLEEHGLNLGNSDEAARHWLVADALTGDLYAAPTREASSVVRQQQLPGEA